MTEPNFQLLPVPRELARTNGEPPLLLMNIRDCSFPANIEDGTFAILQTLLDEMEELTARRLAIRHAAVTDKALTLRLTSEIIGAEEYSLAISDKGVELLAGTEDGLRWGIQTLRQLVATSGAQLPAIVIRDQPAIAVRGFYHDVTRGRVPTRAELERLIDRMSYYKLNQLQLYVEHSFAFRRMPELWGGADPLTAEDVASLVRYGQARGVELVPSLSAFGHCYMFLRGKRFENLNELEVKASEEPFSWIDRMLHYTLDCKSEDALALVESMLDEYLELFPGKLFNICCDETFDLGKGRNRKEAESRGKLALYCDYLQKLVNHLNSRGKTAMFWGDIVGEDPETLKRLSGDYILLDWDYSPTLQYCHAEALERLGQPFYICGGSQNWNRFMPYYTDACQNLTKAAAAAVKHHAAGMLITDWGDYGHANIPANSSYALAIGAAAAWNPSEANAKQLNDAFETLELGATSHGFCDLVSRINAATLVDWGGMAMMADPSTHYGNHEQTMALYMTNISSEAIAKSISTLEQLESELQRAVASLHPAHPMQKKAFLIGMRGLLLAQRVMHWWHCRSNVDEARWLSHELRDFEQAYAPLWHAMSRPSEYYRIRETFLQLGELVDAQLPPFTANEVYR